MKAKISIFGSLEDTVIEVSVTESDIAKLMISFGQIIPIINRCLSLMELKNISDLEIKKNKVFFKIKDSINVRGFMLGRVEGIILSCLSFICQDIEFIANNHF